MNAVSCRMFLASGAVIVTAALLVPATSAAVPPSNDFRGNAEAIPLNQQRVGNNTDAT